MGSLAKSNSSKFTYDTRIALLVAFIVEGVKYFFDNSSDDTQSTTSILDTFLSVLDSAIYLWPYFLLFALIIRGIIWANSKREMAALASNAGFHIYLENNHIDDVGVIQEHLAKDLETARNIKLLGATGFHTFGSSDSFLHQALCKATGEITVILLDPDSSNTEGQERAAALQVDFVDYRREIEASIKMLKDLKSQGKNIRLFVYRHKPLWKIYLTDDHLWLQHYNGNVHVADTPAWGIKQAEDRNQQNFYDYYADVFCRMTDRLDGLNRRIDLRTWEPTITN